MDIAIIIEVLHDRTYPVSSEGDPKVRPGHHGIRDIYTAHVGREGSWRARHAGLDLEDDIVPPVPAAVGGLVSHHNVWMAASLILLVLSIP